MPIIIKGKLIDKTNPICCVPIIESNYDDIISKAIELTRLNVDMVEWRADYYEDLQDEEKLKQILSGLKNIFTNTVFLVTLRSAREGGQLDLDAEDIADLLLLISKTHCADIIDLEYFEFFSPDELIKELQLNGSTVIASYHNFEETPSKQTCIRLLETMAKADADIIKLATMPKSTNDVFALGSAVKSIDSEYDCQKIIISMGKVGLITRIAPGAFDSCVTFGSVDKSSAPGQVNYEKLKELVNFTKNYY